MNRMNRVNVTSSRPIPLGTPSKTASRVVSSRDSIIELLSGIPIFKEEDVTMEDCEIGNGQFGSIKLAILFLISFLDRTSTMYPLLECVQPQNNLQ